VRRSNQALIALAVAGLAATACAVPIAILAVLYAGDAPGDPLLTLQRDVSGPFDPELRAFAEAWLGQAPR
jgi:hypothetical protein